MSDWIKGPVDWSKASEKRWRIQIHERRFMPVGFQKGSSDFVVWLIDKIKPEILTAQELDGLGFETGRKLDYIEGAWKVYDENKEGGEIYGDSLDDLRKVVRPAE